MGNSATAARLMMGVLANQKFEVKITGDKSLCKRPMKRIIEPLINDYDNKYAETFRCPCAR